MRSIFSRQGTAVSVLAVLAFVVVGLADILSSAAASFWAGHAMLTNMISSVIFVLLGATILDQWVKREDIRKLRVIEAVAYSSVGRSLLMQRRVLWVLLNGGRFSGDADFDLTTGEQEQLRGVLSRAELPELAEHDVYRGRKKLPSDTERICKLVTDPEWRALTYRVIRRNLHSSRSIMARWAELLVSSKESSGVLHELAACFDDLQEVRMYMVHWTLDNDEPEPSETERFVQLWRKCFTNSIVVYGQISRKGMTPPSDWSGSVRLLQADDRQAFLLSTDGSIEPASEIRRLYTSESLPSVTMPAEEGIGESSDGLATA